MTASFVFQRPLPDIATNKHALAVRLDRHPTNREAAAIIGLPGYRGIDRSPDGGAVVRFERFGRDPLALGHALAAELARLTAARVVDN